MSKQLIDPETGEIINVSRYITPEQDERISNFRRMTKKARKLHKMIAQHCGGFFFYRYQDLLSVLDGDTATGFRFVYLCACATKEGYFIKYNNELCRTQEDFTYIFDKTKDTVKKYLLKLEERNLIFKDEKGYKLNSLYYYCSLNNDDEQKRNSVRTFRNCVKELYNNSNPNEHALMGELLKFVPYINIYNNVVCWNPEESDKNEVQPLTLRDIRYVIRENSNYGRELEEKLEMIFIKGEPVFGKFEAANEHHYVINPRLLYRGNDPSQFKSLIDQFDIAKGQYLNKQHKLRKRKTENV